LTRVAAIGKNAGFTLVTLDAAVLAPEGPAGRIGAVELAGFVAAATSVLAAPVLSTTLREHLVGFQNPAMASDVRFRPPLRTRG
jgi:hypothetical protein